MDSQVSCSLFKSLKTMTNVGHSTYHNVFEKHHRFVGWLGLAVCDHVTFELKSLLMHAR
jgi:hypothetical protein